SSAGLAAARALNATAVQYPEPSETYSDNTVTSGVDAGIRVGIITRECDEQAWKIARQRFPEDRSGQLTHQLAMKTSDSAWHRQLAQLGELEDTPYWLVPFKNYKTFCPYLVGSYDRVAQELSRYLAVGFTTF